MTEKSEALHHESDPIRELTKLQRFKDAIQALLIELNAKEELTLDTCSMCRLESMGKVKNRVDYEG